MLSPSVVSESYDPMDYSPPGSSVHEISQARILEWVAISFSRGPPQSKDKTQSPELQEDPLPTAVPGKHIHSEQCQKKI